MERKAVSESLMAFYNTMIHDVKKLLSELGRPQISLIKAVLPPYPAWGIFLSRTRETLHSGISLHANNSIQA